MCKKKIFWITGSSFIDVDLPIIPGMLDQFDVEWVIVRQTDCWFSEDFINEKFNEYNVKGKIYNVPGRLRSLQSARMFYDLVKTAKNSFADIYYVNYLGVPYLWPFLLLSGLEKKKIVYPCHDFMDHVGVKNQKIYTFIKKLIFKNVVHFQFFSKTQQKLFQNRYSSKKTFYAPLCLKGFGKPRVNKKHSDKIHFLFFGSIRENKGVEYLIKAGNILHERYSGKFCIKICGGCSYWERLSTLVKHPDCFDFQIRRVENSEIPDLFEETDYLVLPYLDVTQSGPLLISYYYNVPVIASDHEGFREYIEDGKTGFLHQSESVDSLVDMMEKIILGLTDNSIIKDNLKSFVDREISVECIQKKYIDGLMSI